MKLQDLITTRFGIGLALLVARCRPPGLGRSIACFVADRIANRRSSELVRSIAANQWIVSGRKLSRQEVDRAVHRVLRNAGRSLYDFYHNLDNPGIDARLVVFDENVTSLLDRMRNSKEGGVVVAPHLSNFDLAVRTAVQTGVRTLLLTINDGAPAYRLQDLLRRNVNLTVKPVSLHALKDAVRRLREGGSVITGIDRPLPRSRYRPLFFGRRTALPVHHIHLALRTNVPISVISIRREQDGLYYVSASEPIMLNRYPNRMDETIRNAERVLEIAAGHISRSPEQWSMFHPVWPEAIGEMAEID